MYYDEIPIYPIFYLLNVDYRVKGGFRASAPSWWFPSRWLRGEGCQTFPNGTIMLHGSFNVDEDPNIKPNCYSPEYGAHKL